MRRPGAPPELLHGVAIIKILGWHTKKEFPVLLRCFQIGYLKIMAKKKETIEKENN